MMKKLISKQASIKNSTLNSNFIEIKSHTKLTNVLIEAKKIFIDSNVALTNCKIFSNGSVVIKKNSTIKDNSIINSFNGVFIGERVTIDRDVMIGGMQSEKSEFHIGNDSVILYRSYINTTRKISIGNNVGIGGYCLIFTHSSWQNVLEGNPYKFDEVNIEDNVWLPWNVTVFPGVTIGENSTIGGGSVITKNIPVSVFAAGVPAKIIKKKSKSVTIKQKNNVIKEIFIDFSNYASGFLQINNILKIDKNSIIIKSKKHSLILTNSFENMKKTDILCSFKIPSKIKEKYEWIELDSKSCNIKSEIGKKFLLFIKRYGIRVN